MKKKMPFIVFLSMLSFTALAITTTVTSSIKAEFNDGVTEYNRGDDIVVSISINNPPEDFKGIYYDLDYDPNVLEYDDIDNIGLKDNIGSNENSNLLKGYSNSRGKVIISYCNFDDDNILTNNINNKILFNVYFKVLPDAKSGNYQLKFGDLSLLDSKGDIIDSVTSNSVTFSVLQSKDPSAYIFIKEPYDNKVIYQNKAKVNLMYFSKKGYKVKLYNKSLNPDLNEVTFTQGEKGIISNFEVELASGRNNIIAELYNQHDEKIATDDVSIYHSPQNQIIRIISPNRNELLNQQKIDVKLEVKQAIFSGMKVLVNGVDAIPENTTGEIKKYVANITLTEGDNSIVATVTGEKDEVYKDSIDVYYKKDNNLFVITNPEPGASYKPKDTLKIVVEGEIGSEIGENGKENKLSLDVFYKEINSDPVPVIRNGEIVIEKSSLDLGNKYTFRSSDTIDTSKFKTGKLIISVYKNRGDKKTERTLTRVVNIDSNRLYINLLQPHVYSHDNLETQQDLENFMRAADRNKEIEFNDVELSLNGSYKLKATKNIIEVQKYNSNNGSSLNTVATIESNGSIYSLVNNTSNSYMTIYKKSIKNDKKDNIDSWEKVDGLDNHYGYSLCKTNIGILVGVVDNDNSTGIGLYLLDSSQELKKVIIEDTILRNVQFISNIDGTIYLYGNYYNYLFSFKTYDLVVDGDDYKLTSLNKTLFSNSDNLNQFFLDNSGKFAAIRNDFSEVLLYNKVFNESLGEYEFVQTFAKEREGEEVVNINLKAKYIVWGDWSDGEYISCLLVKDDNNIDIVMINKKTGELYVHNAEIKQLIGNEDIEFFKGVGFYDDFFYILYYQNEAVKIVGEQSVIEPEGYYLERGNVFFDKFYKISDSDKKQYEANGEISLGNNQLIKVNDYIFASNEDKLHSLFSEYPANGNANFKYYNKSIDGLTGFSFEIDENTAKFFIKKKTSSDTTDEGTENTDPADEVVENPDSTLRFRILNNNLDAQIEENLIWREISLKDVLNNKTVDNEEYKIYLNQYISDNSNDKAIYEILVELLKEKKNKYFEFKIDLNSIGKSSPKISNLKVYKKVFPKLCLPTTTKPEKNNFTLPIRGIVEDTTVGKVTIKVTGNTNSSIDIDLEEDGSFHHDIYFKNEDIVINIDNNFRYLPVSIECENFNGDKKKLDFKVEIVESKCNIWNEEYLIDGTKTSNDVLNSGEYKENKDEIVTTIRNIHLSANYFGLVNSIIGYELYKEENNGKEVILSKGLLEYEKVQGLVLEPNDTKLSSGYDKGKIFKDNISLFPGKQYIRIYCQNPGGVSKVIEYPSITYKIPKAEEKITLNSKEPIESDLNSNGYPIKFFSSVMAYERSESPTTFEVNNETIKGVLNSNYKTNSLIIKSFTPGLLLIDEDGSESNEIRVKTDIINSFKVNYRIKLSNEDFSKDYDIGIVPENGNMSHLKCAIRITATKSYKNTNFKPDFSYIYPENWTEEQKKSGNAKIPIKFKLNRIDLPHLEYTNNKGAVIATIKLNRGEIQEIFSGEVVVDNGFYYIEGNDSTYHCLEESSLKNGINRIYWRFDYYEYNPAKDDPWERKYTISKLRNSDPNLNDYQFKYEKEEFRPSKLSFEPKLSNKFYSGSADWPVLTILKDKRTKATIQIINSDGINTVYDKEDDSEEIVVDYNLLENLIKQGKNTLDIEFFEDGNKESLNYRYDIQFDNKLPTVEIESYKLSQEEHAPNTFKEFVVNVTDTNFYEAVLLYNGSYVNNKLPRIELKSDNKYKLTWKWEGNSGLLAEKGLSVKVIDKSGRNKTKTLNSIKDKIVKELPDQHKIKKIEMPIYDSSKIELSNLTKDFKKATKFAPAKFLKRVDITDSLNNNRGNLFRRQNSLDNVPIYWSKMDSLDNITSPEAGSGFGSATIHSFNRFYNEEFAKFGKGLGSYSSWDNVSPYVTINNTSNISRGVISFWAYTNQVQDRINGGDSNVTVYMNGEPILHSGVHTRGINSHFFGKSIPPQRFLHHYYIVIDKYKKLSTPDGEEGMSSLLYIDGKFIKASDRDIYNNGKNITFYLETNAPCNHAPVWGKTCLDNVKIWSYIPSVKPDWLFKDPQESRVLRYSNNNELPIYYSEFESTQDIKEAKIGSAREVINNANFIKDTLRSKDGKSLHQFGSKKRAGLFTINNSKLSKGTISYWSYSKGLLGQIGIEINDVILQIGASNCSITVGDKEPVMFDEITGLNHIYIVWDSDKKLEEGKSLRIFANNKEIGFTKDTINSIAKDIRFSSESFEGEISIDKLKVWDTVINENPWFSGELDEISLFKEGYGKYLVFKTAKNTEQMLEANIETLSDYREKITLEVIASKRVNQKDEKPISEEKTETITIHSQEITPSVFETDNDFYYLVNSKLLLETYNLKKVILNSDFLHKPELNHFNIINPGSLSVNFDKFRPEEIYFVGLKDGKIDNKEDLQNDILFYDTRYESEMIKDIPVTDPKYGTMVIEDNFVGLNPNLKIPLIKDKASTKDRTFFLDSDKTDISINFWLRIEDEDGIAGSDITKEGQIRQIFGLRNENFILYYKKIGRSYQLLFKDNPKIKYLPVYLEPKKWNMLTVSISKNTKEIVFYINGNRIGTKSGDKFDPIYLSKNLEEKMFKSGTSYIFGAKEHQVSKAGFFSISNPFYIDKILSNREIIRYTNLRDYEIEKDEETFYFTGGIETSDFEKIGDSGHFNGNENSNYNKKSGSLRASGGHKNFLKIHDSNGAIILSESDDYISINTEVINNGYNKLELKPTKDKGYYYFGNKNGNYGLEADKWYSVAGEVLSKDANLNAKLILKIDGVEKSYNLQEGKFHYIFNNPSELPPKDVVMYIDVEYKNTSGSKGSIELSHEMSLNCGNYIVENSITKSAVSTKFDFNDEGTIHFWYKPLNFNKDGYVNYESVLLDGKYFKFSTNLDDNGDAVFEASMKQKNNDIVLKTNHKVTSNWQHLQLSWNSLEEVLYFYINGNVVGKYKGNIEPFGILEGIVDDKSNLFIGCDIEGETFAEGYIDDVHLNSFYKEAMYEDREFPKAVYIPRDNIINVDNPKKYKIDHFTYRLESLDGTYIDKGSDEIINTINRLSGRYRLNINGVINGINYNDILFFNIDKKPVITIASRSPVVFKALDSDKLSEINFNLRYNNFYSMGKHERIYAGVKISVLYKNSNHEQITKVKYITQGYKQDINRWQEYDPVSQEIKELVLNNAGEIPVIFSNIDTIGKINYELERFYFEETNLLDFKGIKIEDSSPKIGSIPLAEIHCQVIKLTDNKGRDYEHMLEVSLGELKQEKKEINPFNFINDISMDYIVTTKITDNVIFEGSSKFNNDGKLNLYYDDILENCNDGKYQIDLILKYKGNVCGKIKDFDLELKTPEDSTDEGDFYKNSVLEITEFSKLNIYNINANERYGAFRLKYFSKNAKNIKCDIRVTDSTGTVLYKKEGVPLDFRSESRIFKDIKIPSGKNIIKVILTADKGDPTDENEEDLPEGADSDKLKTTEVIYINNIDKAPIIQLKSAPKQNIAYNNVQFDWNGLIKKENGEEETNNSITYSYNFDNLGWTEYTSNKSVSFYELSEGYHSFYIKAKYNEKESDIKSSTFYIDINKPKFNKDKIRYEEKRSSNGILKKVNIYGDIGAITDKYLDSLYFNGQLVEKFDITNGKFEVKDVPVLIDGENTYEFQVFDRVGNKQKHYFKVLNSITEIKFPTNNLVKYCPLTIVGELNESINTPVEIYVKDPYAKAKIGDWSNWKKAQINEDRTFFVEDIIIKPGSPNYKVETILEIASVFDKGETIFTKNIPVMAKEVVMPIEMSLDNYAIQGDNTATEIKISCIANVNNISSWSIDFNGDGLYDQTDIINGSNVKESKNHEWTHRYSSLGKIEPRVRIITRDGNFFSTSEKLIIHERIINANNKSIENPVAMDVYTVDGSSSFIYLLRNDNANNSFIEKYKVGKTVTYPTQKKFVLDLSREFEITLEEGRKRVLVLGEDHFILSDKYNLYEFVMNQLGEFTIRKRINLSGKGIEINDLTRKSDQIYITDKLSGSIGIIPLVDNHLIEIDELNMKTVEIKNSVDMGVNTGITTVNNSILVADFMNQRLLELDKSLKYQNFIGNFGIDGGQFLKPSLVESYENRTLVFDQARNDIQVFNENLEQVSTVKYDNGSDNVYLDPNFFEEIVDMNLFTRLEEGRLYYYAILLSKSSSNLAILKLPNWEELRARIRNNKIVFLRDGDIYSSKPDGGDLAKVVSSDSIPVHKGKLEYPALSPDGRSLAFTSLGKLFNGTNEKYGGNEQYNYDNLYVIDIITKRLKQINLGELNGYEIERPVFSSNGDKLIFSARKNGSNWQIYTYNFKTNEVIKVFKSDANERFPYFSPNDRFVVYSSDNSGDQEIEIIDTRYPTKRTCVTENLSRDSLPVWSNVYPGEVSASNKLILSKIAFVSERDYHKGIYTVYVQQNTEDHIKIVNSEGLNPGDELDSIAVEIPQSYDNKNLKEEDYPCFTGDGKKVLFESLVDNEFKLLSYNYKSPQLSEVSIKGSLERPSGMKNMITDFKAVYNGGNKVELEWSRYTDNDISYFVEYKKTDKGLLESPKRIYGSLKTTITGLEMGSRYQIRVVIYDQNKVEVATSVWKYVDIPVVSAVPSYSIDKDNPYLVYLHGWKPDENSAAKDLNKKWNYSWFVDNRLIGETTSQDFAYEFATHGPKTVTLKVSYSEGVKGIEDATTMNVDIKTDIKPFIAYKLETDGSSIELDATQSEGRKINYADVQWAITSPGYQNVIYRNSQITNVNLNGFKDKIYVSLKLKRIATNDQQATDVIEVNETIDLNVYEVKPVITTEVSQENSREIKFSAEKSLGNIDWRNAQWTITSSNNMEAPVVKGGVSQFIHVFPETSGEGEYYVNLSLPSLNTGQSKAISKVINIKPTPIVPVIEHEIIKLKDEQGNVVGAKLLLNCTNSRGNNIDFNSARWNVASFNGSMNEEIQHGPTAIYSFDVTETSILMDVTLTLLRRGENKPVTSTKQISLDTDIKKGELRINKKNEGYSNGNTITLDVLNSTGPNINWERTTWNIEGVPYTMTGPIVKIDVPFDQEDRHIDFVCTLYRHGGAEPEIVRDFYEVDKVVIEPFIETKRIDFNNNNLYKLSVTKTQGMNIDWERTKWSIYDGNSQVIEKRGPEIMHAFNYSSKKMGYPVLVEMFLKGVSKPFVAYKDVNVGNDKLLPIIKELRESDNKNIITFDASSSIGSNIDWPSAKWTFGDSSETQYGNTVVHQYPNDSDRKEYRVTLTLSRKSSNGSVESVTKHKMVKINSNRIIPKIKVTKTGDTLFLSAEESEGHGLMLERSLWNFDGKGDNQGSVANVEKGHAVRSSLDFDASMNTRRNIKISSGSGMDTRVARGNAYGVVSYGVLEQEIFLGFNASSRTTRQMNWITDASDDYFRGTKSFSNQNTHIGAVCRRNITDTSDSEKTIYVTLTVFRVESDGGVKAESITVGINPNNIKSIYQGSN